MATDRLAKETLGGTTTTREPMFPTSQLSFPLLTALFPLQFRCGSRCGSQTRSTNSSRVPSCADSQPGVAYRLDAVRILPVQSFSRRALGVFGAVFVPVKAANAIGFTKQLKKADISEADYALSEPFLFRAESHFGVKYFDTQLGGGERLEMGKVAVVHFTCRYRGLTALSTREARTLGGNRTIAEPMEFTYGVIPSEFNKPIVRKTVVGIGAEVSEPLLLTRVIDYFLIT